MMECDDDVIIVVTQKPSDSREKSICKAARVISSQNYSIEFYSKFAIVVRSPSENKMYVMKDVLGDNELGNMMGIVCYQRAMAMGIGKMPGASPQLVKEWQKYQGLEVNIVKAEDIMNRTSYFYDFPFGVTTPKEEQPWSLVEFTFEFSWQPARKQIIRHAFMGVKAI